jgi:hypothetical protein
MPNAIASFVWGSEPETADRRIALYATREILVQIEKLLCSLILDDRPLAGEIHTTEGAVHGYVRSLTPTTKRGADGLAVLEFVVCDLRLERRA